MMNKRFKLKSHHGKRSDHDQCLDTSNSQKSMGKTGYSLGGLMITVRCL